MPDCTTIDISKLKLKIPRSEFPLKSDTIIGHLYPELKIQTDECDCCETYHPDVNNDDYSEWNLSNIYMRDYSMGFEELKDLVIKYRGTLIAESTDPRSDGTEYTRIRDGVVKKVKIVEED